MSLNLPDIPLGSLPTDPTTSKIEVTGVVMMRKPEFGLQQFIVPGGGAVFPTGIVFRYADRRYVADLGESITDEAGQPVAALRNWKLSFVNERIAVFGGNETDFFVRFEGKP